MCLGGIFDLFTLFISHIQPEINILINVYGVQQQNNHILIVFSPKINFCHVPELKPQSTVSCNKFCPWFGPMWHTHVTMMLASLINFFFARPHMSLLYHPSSSPLASLCPNLGCRVEIDDNEGQSPMEES